VPERIAAIVAGIAEGCRQAGCALIGGETAEHPGLLAADEYDLAGAGTGVVDEDRLLGPHRVRAGDVVVAIASSGLHSNGYSLVRHVLSSSGWSLERYVDELGSSLGEELLVPTKVYSLDCLALSGAADVEVHAFAHVTGGGLAANLERVLPAGVTVEIDRSTWSLPPIFALVGGLGPVAQPELERTLNMGVGMAAVVAEPDAERAVRLLAERGVRSWVAGSVSGSGAVSGAAGPAARVELVGSYA
jgi:phosphoribosylformylglycinamidine cyclo-ligase